MNHELPVAAWRNGGSGIEADRCRHDESIVVIGVFTDQIDSSWSLVNAWRLSK
jgi:hypothetical protein